MHYVIDGHNLIPFIRGIRLSDLDDELELIRQLQDFARVKRARIEVYFDRAAAGHSGSRSIGNIKAIFVPISSTADAAITKRIRSMGSQAGTCTVVTSDAKIISECKRMRAKVLSSGEFAKLIERAREKESDEGRNETDIDQEEVDRWLDLFLGGNE